METYGTYNGIKFLMDGSMELSFLVPHHEKSRLLASIDEITQAGLPTLEITAKKKRKKSLIVLLPGITYILQILS